MKRFIEGTARDQGGLFPAHLEDFIAEDNPVRVVDAFVDMLDLRELGFTSVDPRSTGRPSYHPSVLLKLYIYGYLNRISSSRRLEREAGRNVELMWLTGRLAPDHKTIADFRKVHGSAIQKVSAQFVVLCRGLGVFAGGVVAVDGSKFKAVNSRDNNFTPTKIARRIEQAEAHIVRYLTALERADRERGSTSDEVLKVRTDRLKHKVDKLRARIESLRQMAETVTAAPDRQISTSDPDARAMASRGNGTNVVGYNVQIAVDRDHHVILTHEVSNVGSDRAFVKTMGDKALAASGNEHLTVLADRGYYSRDQIRACAGTGVTPYIPRTETSGGFKRGKFTSHDYRYDAERDHYVCPAGKHLTKASDRTRKGRDVEIINYRNKNACIGCPLKPRCTPEPYKRVKRWKHAKVLDDMQARLERMPDAMRIRRQTVEHPFGTIKAWMGQSHFLTRTLKNVKTEMSLHILAYNMKRMIQIFGHKALIQKMTA